MLFTQHQIEAKMIATVRKSYDTVIKNLTQGFEYDVVALSEDTVLIRNDKNRLERYRLSHFTSIKEAKEELSFTAIANKDNTIHIETIGLSVADSLSKFLGYTESMRYLFTGLNGMFADGYRVVAITLHPDMTYSVKEH